MQCRGDRRRTPRLHRAHRYRGEAIRKAEGPVSYTHLDVYKRQRAVIAAGIADENDYTTEFLALKMSVAVVDELQSAIDHIRRFGSGHSEAIITSDLDAAATFVRQVDAAAVVVNASTRFVDGAELGLGAEIGISTQKLHARGPMGLEALTCVKYVISGDGHVRRCV